MYYRSNRASTTSRCLIGISFRIILLFLSAGHEFDCILTVKVKSLGITSRFRKSHSNHREHSVQGRDY